MKINQYSLLSIFLFLFSLVTFAQKQKNVLFLRSGVITPIENINELAIDSFSRKAFRQNSAFGILQFEILPNEESKKELVANGITLLDYIPNNAYTASFRKKISFDVLRKAHVRAIVELSPNQKIHPSLVNGTPSASAVKSKGVLLVWVKFVKSYPVEEVVTALSTAKFEITKQDLKTYRILGIQVPVSRLNELAALPFIEYVQPSPPRDQPLNDNSRTLSRGNILNADIADGGRGLNGEGITVGIGDDADVQHHVDFTGRLINFSATSFQHHGTHTTGTLSGAGIKDERYRGYAPKATIISQYFNGIWYYAPTYVQDHGMVVTNNSYGALIGCATNGIYDSYSQMLDQQAFDLPNLQHVFAAGNSGNATCAPYVPGFGTVLGAYQAAKNIITVGNINRNGVPYNNSSKGPVRDGRIKPEIVAIGTGVWSATLNNGYSADNGTSMSSPAVAGGLALLYQRYRQLKSGNPKSALMKAVLCNGASDIGNSGPDFTFGFGSMNLLRSLDMLEKNAYFSGNAVQGRNDIHTIIVPPQTAQLKVMIYWHDPVSSLLTTQALVNDLDLKVMNPSSTTFLPQTLNTSPASVTSLSTQGEDHINNIEQVVIDNPASGTYTINVKGTAITQNPSQEYYVVYDMIPQGLQLTYPAGGETVDPGQSLRIQWEAYGDPVNTFNLEYSTDGGVTWSPINSSVSATSRYYDWTIPATVTDKAMIRIGRNSTSEVNIGKAFTVLGTPVVSLSSTQCNGYISVEWPPVVNATDYEILRLKGSEMSSAGTTTTNSFVLKGLSSDSTYWVGVRARINGKAGRRSVAVSRRPNSGTCGSILFDNDLKLEAIVKPIVGRKGTSTELTSTSQVVIQVRNLDNVVANDFTVKYSINGGATWVSEAVTVGIAAGGIYTHTFNTTADLSSSGNYSLIAVVTNNIPDLEKANDTISIVIRHLPNPALTLAPKFIDNIEAATSSAYIADVIGLSNLDRYDFRDSTSSGRVRTFVSSGIAKSGSKALTLDADRYVAGGNISCLIGTFNLSSYHAATNDIRLGFQFNHHNQVANNANKVWIRGSDTQPWIEVYDLDNNQGTAGTYNHVRGIELSGALLANGQDFSSSFQVRWGQYGQFQTVDRENAAGYTFDDIHIYRVADDMQLVSIDSPTSNSCGLSNTSQIKVTVKNTSNSTLTNVPIKYRINASTWVNEIIPAIAANTTLPYTFTSTADLSVAGPYTIDAAVAFSTDTYSDNDTVRLSIYNSPPITSFPHIQNFETDNGHWYANGTRSTWAYGMPASAKINKAASGTKAWKTRLIGNYNDNEFSYLYSPCFNVSTLTKPTLSFSVALDIEDCGSALCDGTWVEYSTDGVSWTKLGANPSTSQINWYNRTSSPRLWSIENYTRWHVATYPLPTGASNLRLRFVFISDVGITREGIAIDDIHIYDDATNGIYEGVTMTSPVQQTITGGNDWIDFTVGGTLVASIKPNNQNLGATDIQAYLNSSTENNGSQYYLNRSFTIKPTNTNLTDSVAVRLYFMDTESEALIAAIGCSSCTKPGSAYELGVSKYSHTDDGRENNSLCDNNITNYWAFIAPAEAPKVPFLKGYYVEFKVKDFSEFWLNNGGADKLSSLSPIIKVQSSTSICLKGGTINLAALPAGGAWVGNGLTGNVFDPMVAGIGNHILTYNYTDGAGCSFSATTIITVYSNPTITITPVSAIRIDATSIALNALPHGGTWSGAGVTGSTFYPAVAGVGTHSLTYNYTDGNSCNATMSLDVIVNPLPSTLLNFQVKRIGPEDVEVKWSTEKETSVLQYEVEVSRGDDLQNDRYVKIGEITPKGNSGVNLYTFMDKETPKLGLRKYRLKIIDGSGAPIYSDIEPLTFPTPGVWQVYPNPSESVFNLLYKSTAGASLKAELFDGKGRLINTYTEKGTGTIQRLVIDLSTYSNGVYLLQTEVNGEKRFFKLNRQ